MADNAMKQMQSTWGGRKEEAPPLNPADVIMPGDEPEAQIPHRIAQLAIHGASVLAGEQGFQAGYDQATADLSKHRRIGLSKLLTPLDGASMNDLDWSNAPSLLRSRDPNKPTLGSRFGTYVKQTAGRIGRAAVGMARQAVEERMKAKTK